MRHSSRKGMVFRPLSRCLTCQILPILLLFMPLFVHFLSAIPLFSRFFPTFATDAIHIIYNKAVKEQKKATHYQPSNAYH